MKISTLFIGRKNYWILRQKACDAKLDLSEVCGKELVAFRCNKADTNGRISGQVLDIGSPWLILPNHAPKRSMAVV
jgi:hypothetical protein